MPHGFSAAGTPLPHTLEDLKRIPSVPVEQPEQGDDFIADDFQPDAPGITSDDFVQDDFQPDTPSPLYAVTGPSRIGASAQRAVEATKERALAVGESLRAATRPGLPFWSATGPSRVGEAALGALQGIGIVTAPGESLVGDIAEATLPTAPAIEQRYAPAGHPWRQPVTPEAATAARREVGEVTGGVVGPLGAARGLLRLGRRGAVAATPGVELPAAVPKAPRALPEIPGPVVATEDPIRRTLQAAQEQATGRALDLGTVGRKRALERNRIREIEEPATPADAKPIEAPTVSAPATTAPAEVSPEKLGLLKRGAERLGRGKNLLRRATATDTPSDFAKGNPSAEQLVSRIQDRAVTRQMLEEDVLQEVADIYKPLLKKKESIQNVNRVLDTDGGAAIAPSVLNKTELAVYQQMRQWFDKTADSMQMEPGKRVTDYFPRLREQLGVQERKIVQVGGKEVPTYITDVTPNRIVKEHFEKARTSAAPADDLGLEPVLAYARGAARKIAYGGGKHPVTGEAITPLLDDIKDLLPGIPDDKAKYFSDYVNDVIGIPRAKPGEVSQAMIEANKKMKEKLGVDVTGLEFGRTISGNLMTPTQNLTQSLLTLGHVSPVNWTRSWAEVPKVLIQNTEWERLRRLGIVSRRTKADDDLLAQMGKQRGLGKAIELGSTAFRGTENINRAHAFYSGLHEAASKGLQGAEAERFARDIVRKTQFVFGPEDAAELSRAVRNPLGRSVLQYKSFPAKYAIAMKQLAQDDLAALRPGSAFYKAIAQGDVMSAIREAPIRFAKVAGATGGLFGAGAVIPSADEIFGLDQESLLSTGLVGAAGLSLGHSAGLGALPLDSLRSFTFFLPGPLITHFLDAASAGASIATQRQINLDLKSIIKDEFGVVANEIDPEITTQRIVQSIPLAGIQADRIRQGIIHARSTAPQAQRKPGTLLEALAIKPLGPSHQRIKETPGSQAPTAARIALGAREPRAEKLQDLAARLQRDSKLDAASARRAAQLLIQGNTEEAQAIIQSRGLPPSPQGLQEAAKGAAMPPEIRRGLRAPLPLRGPYLQNIPPLPPIPGR